MMERWQSLAECAALEMRFTLACNGGSNPSLSALDREEPRAKAGFFHYIILHHRLSYLRRLGIQKFGIHPTPTHPLGSTPTSFIDTALKQNG